MKKNVTLLFALLFMSAMAFAQAPIQDGEKQVNVGIGLSNYGLPIYAGIDFGIGNNISVGGGLTYRNYSDNIGTYKWSHTIISIAGHGNYHFGELLSLPSNIDVYGGLSLGFSYWKSSYDGPGDLDFNDSQPLYLVGQVGGRYFFNDRMAVNVEFGGGNYFSGGKVGITYKL